MDYRNDRKYSESHEWALQDGDVVTVGISDYAQDQLGDVVFVELPAAGKTVKAKDPVAVVESVKTASDIYAPVSGEIVEVNDALESTPEVINEDPFGAGWLFRIRPTNPGEIAELLDADAYRASAEEDS